MSEVQNKDDLIIIDTEKQTQVTQKVKLLELVHSEHPILRQSLPEFDFKNPPINPSELASSLVETCKMHHGIGLSANQCGLPYRVFVMGAGEDFVAFFNPKITMSQGEVHMVEGCLSFPFLALRITRPEIITVEYQDFNGNKREVTLSGISARCFQHELDHMNGIVYTSKVKPLALQMGMQKRNKILKKLKLK